LANKFLPGPLSIVLKKNPSIPNIVTSDLQSIGIRMPDHIVMLEILRKLNKPMAGTSANMSGMPARLYPKEVFHDFDGKIAAVLDDGPSPLGIASTVLDLTKPAPFLIRKGNISKEEIESVINRKVISY
jgi:L-threonylcarbamoyladenylate synthase